MLSFSKQLSLGGVPRKGIRDYVGIKTGTCFPIPHWFPLLPAKEEILECGKKMCLRMLIPNILCCSSSATNQPYNQSPNILERVFLSVCSWACVKRQRSDLDNVTVLKGESIRAHTCTLRLLRGILCKPNPKSSGSYRRFCFPRVSLSNNKYQVTLSSPICKWFPSNSYSSVLQPLKEEGRLSVLSASVAWEHQELRTALGTGKSWAPLPAAFLHTSFYTKQIIPHIKKM